MLGVITNFRDWIFTKYNLKAEMENKGTAFEADKFHEIVDYKGEHITDIKANNMQTSDSSNIGKTY